MDDPSTQQLRATIAAARAHTAVQLDEARRLEGDLPILNQRLGVARSRQEQMRRPSTLVTETGRQKVERWLVRLHIRRPST